MRENTKLKNEKKLVSQTLFCLYMRQIILVTCSHSRCHITKNHSDSPRRRMNTSNNTLALRLTWGQLLVNIS